MNSTSSIDDRGAAPQAGNPYLSVPASEALPDLDLAAPTLRGGERRRIDRRALVLLAGIVVLLVLATVWMLHSASAGREHAPPVREEAVAVPELPRAPRTEEMSSGPDTTAAPDSEVPPLPLLPAPPSLPSADIAAPSASPMPIAPPTPSLVERRMGLANGDGSSPAPQPDPYAQALLAAIPGAPSATQPPGSAAETDVAAAPAGLRRASLLHHADTLLVRGTYIRCVLQARIVTDVPGYASCVVTEPVHSVNGRRLLLPRGSRITGRYGGEANGPRVAVVWDRITTPTGLDVAVASPGVDGLGSAGHPGDYDAHWGSRIGAALLISMIADGFQYAAAEYGPPTTTVANGTVVQSPFESATARTMERLADRALARAANRPATVTIPQGELLAVYVAQDVDFANVLSR